MKAVSVERDYEPIEAGVDIIIYKTKTLPEKVFRETFKYFLFITFDDLLMPHFFNHLKQFLIEVGEERFWLTVIDPEPKLYFGVNFTFFGSFEFSNADTENDYISALNEYPKDSLADALAHNSNSLLISSFTYKWAIFGNRDADIAICAFSDRTQMELFESFYGYDLLDGVKAAAKYAYSATGDNALIETFCKNYVTE